MFCICVFKEWRKSLFFFVNKFFTLTRKVYICIITSLQKYKIIAFTVLFKKKRSTGVYYDNEGSRAISKLTGIGRNSVIKYTSICKELGILKKCENSEHYQFIGFVKMFELLGLQTEQNRGFYHVRFFRHVDYKSGNLQTVVNQIKKGLLLRNIVQQDFKIKHTKRKVDTAKLLINCTPKDVKNLTDSKKKEKNLSFYRLKAIDLKRIKRLVKEAAHFNSDTVSYSKSLIDKWNSCKNDSIRNCVTGKRHLAKVLGMSDATAARVIFNTSKQEGVTRKVVKEYFPLIEESFKYLKSKGHKNLFISNGKIVSIKGSIIRLDYSSPYFKYLPSEEVLESKKMVKYVSN